VGRVRTAARLSLLGCCAGLALGAGHAAGALLPDPEVTAYPDAEVQRELNRFEAVGDGIVLTLAACEEEPHCITAMSEHELARLIERIEHRIDHLEAVRDDAGLEPAQENYLARYRSLRDRYVEYLRQVRIVGLRIDADSFEQAWEDLLDFGVPEFDEPVDTGPDVPSPNDQLTLDRFQDADEPMPID
jgi:hypothetical protein